MNRRSQKPKSCKNHNCSQFVYNFAQKKIGGRKLPPKKYYDAKTGSPRIFAVRYGEALFAKNTSPKNVRSKESKPPSHR